MDQRLLILGASMVVPVVGRAVQSAVGGGATEENALPNHSDLVEATKTDCRDRASTEAGV